MTATMERRAPAARRAPVRRSQTALERFEQKTDWPFFGTVSGTRRYVAPGQLANVAQWIAQHVNESISTSAKMERALTTCAKVHPTWFVTATAVRLEKASRDLPAGVVIFHMTRNFSRIPDTAAPESVSEIYTNAFMENPNRTFVYLEPLWREADGKRTPTTIEDFNTLVIGQHNAIRKMVPRIRTMNAVLTIVDVPVEILTMILCVVFGTAFMLLWGGIKKVTRPTLRALTAPIFFLAHTKERHILSRAGRPVFTELRTQTTLAEAVGTILLPSHFINLDSLVMKYDPIIAFEVPELREAFGGKPLALVAHWD